MYLENVVFDAVDPRRLGRFWERVLDTETLTDEPDGYETRLHHPGGSYLDLCFQRVPEPPSGPLRLQLVVSGGDDQQGTVDRLLGLGAGDPDVRQPDGPGVVVGDAEGGAFAVTDDQGAYVDTGPLAALRLESGDPHRDAELWGWLTGWSPAPGLAPVSLRHPSARGPWLELSPEIEPKRAGKNRRHLDVRLERGDDPDDVELGIAERGGRRLDHDWGDLPWRSYVDASGNEFCVLPAPA